MKRQFILPPLIMTTNNHGKNLSPQKMKAIFDDIRSGCNNTLILKGKHGVSVGVISKYKNMVGEGKDYTDIKPIGGQ